MHRTLEAIYGGSDVITGTEVLASVQQWTTGLYEWCWEAKKGWSISS